VVIEGRATEGGILRGSSRLRRMSVFGLCWSWWQRLSLKTGSFGVQFGVVSEKLSVEAERGHRWSHRKRVGGSTPLPIQNTH